MTSLHRAIDAAQDRKEAAFPDGSVGVVAGEFESRAVFSGFDVDHDELTQVARLAGNVFYAALLQGDVGPRAILSSAWTEGFLIGLLFTQGEGQD